jgi:hypothetical protein
VDVLADLPDSYRIIQNSPQAIDSQPPLLSVMPGVLIRKGVLIVLFPEAFWQDHLAHSNVIVA